MGERARLREGETEREATREGGRGIVRETTRV